MRKEEQILEIVGWWEKLRLIYNLFVFIAFSQLIVMTDDAREVWLNIFFVMLYWFFGANVFYTMSWASEILYVKYFGKFMFNKLIRRILFVLGTLFSMIWTIVGI